MSDLAIFTSSMRDLLRLKRLIAALVVALVPGLLALTWRMSVPNAAQNPELIYNMLVPGLVFGFLLVILSVVFSTGVVAQEIEQKTIVYLLTRPVPRWRILLMKFAAALLVTTLVVWLSTLITAGVAFGFTGWGGSQLGRDLVILPIGALAYGALFLLLATLINRPLVAGLMFAFVWESWVPNMPGAFKEISLMTYLRILAPHPTPDADSPDMSGLMNALSPQTISSPMAWKVLIAAIAAALIGAMVIFSRKEYVPREDAE